MHSNLTPESNGHPALLRAVKKLELRKAEVLGFEIRRDKLNGLPR